MARGSLSRLPPRKIGADTRCGSGLEWPRSRQRGPAGRSIAGPPPTAAPWTGLAARLQRPPAPADNWSLGTTLNPLRSSARAARPLPGLLRLGLAAIVAGAVLPGAARAQDY